MDIKGKLRKLTPKDIDLLYNWAKDRVVRVNSFNQDFLSYDEHVNWFNSKINNPNSHIFIFELDHKGLGQIRFDIKDNVAEIDYSIDAEHRGKGYGLEMLKQGTEKILLEDSKIEIVRGIVKANNLISYRAFLSVGYKLVKENSEYFIFELCK